VSYTYAQLKQAVQDYTENDETTFVNNLPIFIKNAEERILKGVQLTVFRKNVSGSMTTGNKFLAVPSDFLAPLSLAVTDSDGNKHFLEFKDVGLVQTFNPDGSDTGRPKYYSLFDIGFFLLGPTPDQDYSSELHYFYRPVSLTAGSDSGTTWLSENATVSMLYGSLVEAYTFMKGEADMMNLYNQLYVQSLGSLKQFGESKEVMDDYRSGLLIRPKQ
jgi:hypothetical protein